MYVHHTGSLENCTALCLQESDCTAFNYASSSTGCVLRRCKLPIVPPAKNLWPTFDGFWQSSCSVSSGPAAGKDCVFPFTFHGTTYKGESKNLTKSPKTKTYRASKLQAVPSGYTEVSTRASCGAAPSKFFSSNFQPVLDGVILLQCNFQLLFYHKNFSHQG